MRFEIKWTYQGRDCSVFTDSQIDATITARALSQYYATDVTVNQSIVEVIRYRNGQLVA